ncbi:uncharacterized protein DUF3800 [Stackebrandtia endophytica]|uniref:Uncharacterized protein DUF3800 n=2 Tax=Stackebrandtia endophytica TaxID=1496996 RepID=A0A543AQE3_9ACTN|nr:uncharacterized protein DUF3800 [Stackebrandtia endophytica]
MAATAAGWVEVACDESGYEGEKLVEGSTTSFAHAGVDLSVDAAAECVRELRRRIRSPATEYKANHLMRSKHRGVLVWLLGPTGPLVGHGRVFLIDKTRYLLESLVDLLVNQEVRPLGRRVVRDEATRSMARLLRDNGRSSPMWPRFLVAANELMRVKERPETPDVVSEFFDALSPVAEALTGEAAGLAVKLAGGRSVAETFRSNLPSTSGTSPLDPLLPALVQAVRYWGADHHDVVIHHDRQNTLSPDRVADLTRVVGESSESGHLRRVELVESAVNAPVQLADILAGTIRTIADADAVGDGDAELLDLLGPYIDPESVWGARRWIG